MAVPNIKLGTVGRDLVQDLVEEITGHLEEILEEEDTAILDLVQVQVAILVIEKKIENKKRKDQAAVANRLQVAEERIKEAIARAKARVKVKIKKIKVEVRVNIRRINRDLNPHIKASRIKNNLVEVKVKINETNQIFINLFLCISYIKI